MMVGKDARKSAENTIIVTTLQLASVQYFDMFFVVVQFLKQKYLSAEFELHVAPLCHHLPNTHTHTQGHKKLTKIKTKYKT